MIIDELVTLIGFDLSPSAKKAFGTVDKSISSITDKMKGLGIVSAVTGGLFSAFSVNAAKEVQALSNLSDHIGVNRREIHALQEVYRQLGGSMQEYQSDATKFWEMTHKPFNTENIKEFTQQFKNLPKEIVYSTLLGMGYSKTLARSVSEDIEALSKKALETATPLEKSFEKLSALNSEWNVASGSFDAVATDIQGALAPTLTEVLDDLKNFVIENRADIVDGAEAIGAGLSKAWNDIKEAVKEAWPIIKKIWEFLDAAAQKGGGWENAIRGVADAFTVLAGIKIAGSVLKVLSFLAGGSSVASAAKGLAGLGGAATAGGATTAAAGGWFAKAIAASKAALGSTVLPATVGAIVADQGVRYARSGADNDVSDTTKIVNGIVDDVRRATASMTNDEVAEYRAEFMPIIDALRHENLSSSVKDAIAPSNYSSPFESMKKGYDRDRALSGLFDSIDDERIAGMSIQEKRIQGIIGTPSIRRKLRDGGWANDEMDTGLARRLTMAQMPVPSLIPSETIRDRGRDMIPYGSDFMFTPNRNPQTNNITIYQVTPPSPNGDIYVRQGGMGYQRAVSQ